MVKALFVGDVMGIDRWHQLVRRLKELLAAQTFDVLFIVGKLDLSDATEEEVVKAADYSIYLENVATSLKMLSFHAPLVSPEFAGSEAGRCILDSIQVINESGGYAGITTVTHNDAHLTVAYANIENSAMATNDMRAIDDVVSSIGYRGCDLLLTSEWPKGMHHFLSDGDSANYRAMTVGTSIGIGSGSPAAALIATMVRPRYHFVGGQGVFYQRQPYVNRTENTSKASTGPYTRLISVNEISDADVTKEKMKKWLHALSLKCIIHMTAEELADAPAGATECPFLDQVPSSSGTSSASHLTKHPFLSNGGDSADAAPAKRFKG